MGVQARIRTGNFEQVGMQMRKGPSHMRMAAVQGNQGSPLEELMAVYRVH